MSRAVVHEPTVNFLIVGAQKTGTTTLYHMLMQNQEIFLPRRKELHFFDTDDVTDWACPDYASYEDFFRGKRDTQSAGEATPIYSYWPPCMERIRKYNSDMKLIMCLRDPADRAFSHWSMESAHRQESMPFSDAIRQGRARVVNGPGCRSGHHRIYSYVERGFYAPQIANILTHFPAEQLLVVKYDDFHNDLRGFLDTICRLLGVSEFTDYPQNKKFRARNPSADTGSLSVGDRDYLATLFEKDIRDTQEITGLDLSAWLKSAVARD